MNSFCMLALLMLLPHLPFYIATLYSHSDGNCVEWRGVREWDESKKLSNIIATQLCTEKKNSQQQKRQQQKIQFFIKLRQFTRKRDAIVCVPHKNSLTVNGYESQHDKFSTPFTFALSHYLIRISLLFAECIVIDWGCFKGKIFVYQQI